MSPKELTALRIDPELLDGLRTIKERDGVPVSEQIRRALQAWLKANGVDVVKKPERKRAATRKRS
jgi:hypothetical protein